MTDSAFRLANMYGSIASVAMIAALAISCSPSNPVDEPPSSPEAAQAPAARDGFEIATVRVSYRVEGPGPMRGTSVLWIEDFGARAGTREELAAGSGPTTRVDTLWDGSRSHIRNGSQPVAQSSFRPISTEASAMARSSEAERAAIGWVAQGERTVAGQTCSVWRNDQMGGIELCVWRGVDLQMLSRAQRREAVEIVEGERMPAEIGALAAR